MLALIIIAILLTIINVVLEFKRDLMMLQQNSYRPERYSRWLRESGDTTAPRRLMGFVVFFIALSLFSHALGSQALMLLFGAFTSWHLLRQKYKKPLVWTPRARRIYAVAAVLALLTIVGAVFAFACSVDSALYSAAVAALLIPQAAVVAHPVLIFINKAAGRVHQVADAVAVLIHKGAVLVGKVTHPVAVGVCVIIMAPMPRCKGVHRPCTQHQRRRQNPCKQFLHCLSPQPPHREGSLSLFSISRLHSLYDSARQIHSNFLKIFYPFPGAPSTGNPPIL